MSAFQSRRRYGGNENRKPIWLILLICALSALVLTVVTGLLLRLFLDEEALELLTKGEAEEELVLSDVRNVRAYPFRLGENTDGVWENPHVSLTLNTPSGKTDYRSPVASHLGYGSRRDVTLADGMEALLEPSSYISGVFYPTAPMLSTADLRYAEAMREIAVMQEFLRAGGNEIMLCGIVPGENGVSADELIQYVKTVKAALGDVPVCVALPLSFLLEEDSYKTLSRLSKVCDLMALDLREADGSRTPAEWLSECDYHLTQYDMRLLLCETQTGLSAEAERLKDYQILERLPASELIYPVSPDGEE